MLLPVATLILILLCEVKSDIIRPSKWKDMKNGSINNIEEYCTNKNCMIKCCPDGTLIVKKQYGIFACYPIKVAYDEFNKYIAQNDSLSTSNVSYFQFVQNDHLRDLNKENNKVFFQTPFKLYKDGSMKYLKQDIPKLKFCVDFVLTSRKSEPRLGFKLDLDPVVTDVEAKSLFIIIGMLISSFFMFVVLVVYALLPNLQNIVGKVLMAYLLTISIGYTLRASQMIVITYPSEVSFSCSDSSPAYYFFILSSFFWLNIMSFDLWWTLRGQRKCRDIHRQGELVKFLWYCTYAWGAPLMITLLVLMIQKLELYTNDKYKPPFEDCFAEEFKTRLYLHLPIGIMTFINFILFSMTVYNIWLIKRSVVNNNDSRNTKRQNNRFAIYIKLFILMGVTWVFEQFSTEEWVWLILLNFMTLFSGVFIFYMFVCKKNIILMLCKRFNIQNRFVERLHPSNHSCTETSRCSEIKSRRSQKPSIKSMELATLSTEI